MAEFPPKELEVEIDGKKVVIEHLRPINREMQLEENADFHARLSTLETQRIADSRRITALENGTRGHYDDDPMKSLQPLMWIMLALTVAPMVMDLVKSWRSLPSS